MGAVKIATFSDLRGGVSRVEVEWVDSGCDEGWTEEDTIRAGLEDDAQSICVTVGYLIHEDDDRLAVCQSLAKTEPVGARARQRADDPEGRGCVRQAAAAMTGPEQSDLLDRFLAELRKPTGDGAKKRARNEKPPWFVDDSHEAAIFSHLTRWKRGEIVDEDSGAHPLVHVAWRCLAIACRESGNVPE